MSPAETERGRVGPATADVRLPGREALAMLLYFGAWVLGFYVSTSYWFLPAGMRFACLWTMPRRRWAGFALAEFAAILVIVLQGEAYRTWTGFILGVLVPWVLHAAVVVSVRRSADGEVPDTPWRMARLLLAMLAAALVTAGVLTVMTRLEAGAAFSDPALHLLHFAIGDFIGMLIVVPIWLHLRATPARGARRLLLELLLLFVPTLLLVPMVPLFQANAVVYATLLALVPMIFMAFRHGWKGGGWSLAFTSIAVYLLDRAASVPHDREVMQLFLCIVGAVTLVLGASVDALRRTRDALSQRSAALSAQAVELRALGARLVRSQEDERRRIAQELQGELEQGITAIGTRLGLLARTPLEPAQMAAIDSLRGLTQDMQASMREVLVRLRPAALDRQGLEQALRAGPIRELLGDVGIELKLALDGSPDSLDDDLQAALFRICQEAAVDCVRRRLSRRFEMRMVVLADRVELDIHYDGDAAGALRGQGGEADGNLALTRDRVLAFGGGYGFQGGADGVRHHVELPREPG